MRVSIRLDDRELRDFEREFPKQAPFGIAVGLTRTVKIAQERLRKDLGKTFTLRNKYVQRGIRIIPARKNNLAAAVGHVQDYMRMHATGGVKKGTNAVPIRARKNKGAKTPPSKWPGRLLQRKNYNLMELETGRAGVAKMSGRGGVNMALWWAFVRDVRIEKRWPFWQTTRKVFERNGVIEIAKGLRRAIETAKPRKRRPR